MVSQVHPLRVGAAFGLVLALAVLMSATSALAEETRIAVRVLAKDAKFVGTSMGGVDVVITDADTGEVLERGVTVGGTGDTDLLMIQAAPRRTSRVTPGAAVFETVLDIDAPRKLVISASGPLGQAQARARASVELWVAPGKHLDVGDGVVLELPGFVVDVQSPGAHSFLGPVETVDLTTHVVMMCGCTVSSGGLWDADGYEVSVRLSRNGVLVREEPLAYAGAPNSFSARRALDGPGAYLAQVAAYDPATGNTGVDATSFIVE